jgi:hypothetical protein
LLDQFKGNNALEQCMEVSMTEINKLALRREDAK